MYATIHVLVIGRQPAILEAVVTLIQKTPDWDAAGAATDEQAIELFQQRRFDLVLLGAGVAAESEAKLRAIFSFQNPLIRIIQHLGAGSDQLFEEIRAALTAQLGDNYVLSDNPFQGPQKPK